MNLPATFSFVALICYLVLVVIALQRGVRDRANRLFMIYLMAMAFWQIAALMVSISPDANMALYWYKLMAAGASMHLIVYFFFVRAFLRIKDQQKLVYIGYVACAITLLLSVRGTNYIIESVYRDESTGLYVPTFGILVFVLALCGYFFLGQGIFNLFRGYKRAKSDLERNRLKYLLVGISIVILGTLANFSPFLKAYPVDIIANIINALLIAYAILRYRLLDITLVVRKGLLYSIPTAIIGAGYFLLISLTTRLFHAFTGIQILLLSLLVATTTAVVAQPLRDKAQLWVDRLFFREKYDANLMLQRLSRTVASVLDFDRLTNMILDEVSTTMHIEGAAFFLKQEKSKKFVLMAQRGLNPNADVRLGNDHPIVDWLSRHENVLTRQDIDVMPQFKALWGREQEDLERMEAELFIPLKAKGELVGIFTVGTKLSQETYSQDDQRTLTTLANQTAMAIDNARLYEAAQQELTQRKRAEQEIRRRATHLEALNAIIAAAAAASDLLKLLESALDHTMQALGLERGVIWLTRDWRCGGLKAQEASPIHPAPPGSLHVLRGLPPESNSVLAHVAQTGGSDIPGPIAVEDLRLTPVGTLAARFGIRASLTVPILIEGQRIGGLSLLAPEPRPWSAEEIALVEAVGQQLGTAVERLRLFQEVRRHAEELAAALARSQELDRLKGEFIQNVSHELRTPLALIRGYATCLGNGELGELLPEQGNAVEIIVRRSQMLSELVGDITLILGAEVRPLAREPVALDELARAAVEDFQVVANQAELTLRTEIAPGVLPAGGETVYLRRVLDNLLGNAIKFTPAGNTITVRVRQEDGRVILQVSDTGVGIPAEQRERIFERFYQVDGSARRRYGGMGLGLALVKEVVEALGGEVGVESEVGLGSTFTVWLPVAEEG